MDPKRFGGSDITVLKNQHVVLQHDGASLVLAGVNDIGAHISIPRSAAIRPPRCAARPLEAGAKILLAHQPSSASAAARAGFDVQISGHTHGGQFWPWNHFVRFFQPFTAGLHRLKRSLGLCEPRHRLLGPPNRFGVPRRSRAFGWFPNAPSPPRLADRASPAAPRRPRHFSSYFGGVPGCADELSGCAGRDPGRPGIVARRPPRAGRSTAVSGCTGLRAGLRCIGRLGRGWGAGREGRGGGVGFGRGGGAGRGGGGAGRGGGDGGRGRGGRAGGRLGGGGRCSHRPRWRYQGRPE